MIKRTIVINQNWELEKESAEKVKEELHSILTFETSEGNIKQIVITIEVEN